MPDAPWDTSPATEQQKDYFHELAQRLAVHNVDDVDRTMLSEAIKHLNNARNSVGLKFAPIEGMDSARQS